MYVLTDQIGVIVHPICFLALTGDQGDMMLCVCLGHYAQNGSKRVF